MPLERLEACGRSISPLALADPGAQRLLDALSVELDAVGRRGAEPLYHLEEFQEAELRAYLMT